MALGFIVGRVFHHYFATYFCISRSSSCDINVCNAYQSRLPDQVIMFGNDEAALGFGWLHIHGHHIWGTLHCLAAAAFTKVMHHR